MSSGRTGWCRSHALWVSCAPQVTSWMAGGSRDTAPAGREEGQNAGRAGFVSLCPCSFVCSLGRTWRVPAASLGAEFVSIPPFSPHIFSQRQSPAVCPVGSAPSLCPCRGGGRSGAALLQGTSGTSGTCWAGLLLPDLAEFWMLSPAPGLSFQLFPELFYVAASSLSSLSLWLGDRSVPSQ